MGSTVTTLSTKTIDLKHKNKEIKERKERKKKKEITKEEKEKENNYYKNKKLKIFLNLLQNETNEIRMKILKDIPLQFQYQTIIIIYSPPLSSLNDLSLYLSYKFRFIIFNLNKKNEFNNYNNEYYNFNNNNNNNINNNNYNNNGNLLTENSYYSIGSQQSYHHRNDNSSSNNNNSSNDNNEKNQNDSYPLLNNEDELIPENFRDRISQKDCKQGFILLNYPHNITEAETLNNMTKNYKKVVIHIEQDFNKLLRVKCADWVHLASGRRYHILNKPPLSMKGTVDDVRNMYDDITAEALHQVIDRKKYHTELRYYSKYATAMKTYYSHSMINISGEQSIENLKDNTLSSIFQVIANQPKINERLQISTKIYPEEELEHGILNHPVKTSRKNSLMGKNCNNDNENDGDNNNNNDNNNNETKISKQSRQDQTISGVPLLHLPSNQDQICYTQSIDSIISPHPKTSQSEVIFSQLLTSESNQLNSNINTLLSSDDVIDDPSLLSLSKNSNKKECVSVVIDNVKDNNSNNNNNSEKSHKLMTQTNYCETFKCNFPVFSSIRRFSNSSSKKESDLDDDIVPSPKSLQNGTSTKFHFHQSIESDSNNIMNNSNCNFKDNINNNQQSNNLKSLYQENKRSKTISNDFEDEESFNSVRSTCTPKEVKHFQHNSNDENSSQNQKNVLESFPNIIQSLESYSSSSIPPSID